MHSAVWQRLPRSLRRSALFALADLLAPTISESCRVTGPIIVVGPLQTASGLGESARLCHDALKVLGHPVFGIDVTHILMQPDDGAGFQYADGRGVIEPATLIFHVNAPLMALAMLSLPRKLVRQSRVIGYWAWELSGVPADWLRGTRFVHEIWVPSAFTEQAIQKIANNLSVRVVPHPIGIRSVRLRAPLRDRSKPFVVLSMFNMASSMARKNPLGAIEAFKAAFGDDDGARLIIKCSNLDVFPSGANQLRASCSAAGNIVLSEKVMDPVDLDALYGEADAVVSLHRSEGFGLVIAEAMLRGIPVVATDWSGNTDFLCKATGVPIDYDLVPAVDPQSTYDFPETAWAEPRIEEAVQALRDLRSDPAWARSLGDRAADFAAAAFGPAAYAEAIGHKRFDATIERRPVGELIAQEGLSA